MFVVRIFINLLKLKPMKRFGLLAAVAVLAAFMSSCEMFGEEGLVGGKMRLKAYTETHTRTTLGEDLSVLWSEGDQIVVMGADISAEDGMVGAYDLVSGAGTTEGVFEGELNREYPAYYAFYPSNLFNQGVVDGSMLVVLPHNAVFAERNFVSGANPMVAYGTKDEGLQFKNICGILELKIKGKGTINSLKIDVGAEDPYIGGYFVLTPDTQSLEPYNVTKTIVADLEAPIELLESEARSIYAIMPPGEYKELTVTTTDNIGNVSTRKATATITIERSRITQVSEFEHKTIEVPYATATYLPEKSSFMTSIYMLNFNSLAAGAVRLSLLKSQYEELIAGGQDDVSLLNSSGKFTPAPGECSLNSYSAMGQRIIVLAAPTDESGAINGEVTKMEFVAKTVPVDNTYSVNLTSKSVDAKGFIFEFDATPVEGAFRAAVFTKESFNELSEWEKDVYSASTYADHGMNYLGGKITYIREDLVPNTDYVIIYRVANGEFDYFGNNYTAYSAYQIYEFKTPEYVKSSAKIDVKVEEVKDMSARFSFTASSDSASWFMMFYTTVAEIENLETVIDQSGQVVFHNEPYTLEGLQPNTTYYFHALAYEATEGVYGEVTTVSFTTVSLFPEQVKGYSDFLGTYTFTCENSEFDNGPRNVVVSQDVEGKTYRVTGLMSDAVKAQYGIADDTVIARYYGEKIHIGGVQLADSGNTGQNIYIAPLSATGYYWPGNELCSSYNEGALELSHSQDGGYNGFLFYVGTAINNATSFLESYVKVRLVKQQGSNPPSGDSSGTESFTRSDEVNAGWM